MPLRISVIGRISSLLSQVCGYKCVYYAKSWTESHIRARTQRISPIRIRSQEIACTGIRLSQLLETTSGNRIPSTDSWMGYSKPSPLTCCSRPTYGLSTRGNRRIYLRITLKWWHILQCFRISRTCTDQNFQSILDRQKLSSHHRLDEKTIFRAFDIQQTM